MKTVFKEENCQKDLLIINVLSANLWGIAFAIPTALIFGLPFYFIWKNIGGFAFPAIFSNTSVNILVNTGIYVLAFVVGIVLHELIHGIVWAKYASRGWKSIKLGIMWDKLCSPYCHCSEPLQVRHYITGAIMPMLILGVLPAITAIIIGNGFLLVFGIIFTIAAIGDLMIINLLRKENATDWVQDHPSEAGCWIYRSK
ncbi:MAG: DUF3267 domain-containing protein [Prevotellaceae bacterium]|jgi:hypothetical protein|nr:DUF3267 domain-containing protein [Prevotellaceae bacterium]